MEGIHTGINGLIDKAIIEATSVGGSFNYYSIFKKNLVYTKLNAKRYSDAYYSGYIHGLHDAKKIIEED